MTLEASPSLITLKDLMATEAFVEAGKPYEYEWGTKLAPRMGTRSTTKSYLNASGIAETLRELHRERRIRILKDHRPVHAFYGGYGHETYLLLDDATLCYDRERKRALIALYAQREPDGGGRGKERFRDLVAASRNPWFVEGTQPPPVPDETAHQMVGYAVAALYPGGATHLEVTGPAQEDEHPELFLVNADDEIMRKTPSEDTRAERAKMKLLQAIVVGSCGVQWAISRARSVRDEKEAKPPSHAWRVWEATTPRQTLFECWRPPDSAIHAAALRKDPDAPRRRLALMLEEAGHHDLAARLEAWRQGQPEAGSNAALVKPSKR